MNDMPVCTAVYVTARCRGWGMEDTCVTGHMEVTGAPDVQGEGAVRDKQRNVTIRNRTLWGGGGRHAPHEGGHGPQWNVWEESLSQRRETDAWEWIHRPPGGARDTETGEGGAESGTATHWYCRADVLERGDNGCGAALVQRAPRLSCPWEPTGCPYWKGTSRFTAKETSASAWSR